MHTQRVKDPVRMAHSRVATASRKGADPLALPVAKRDLTAAKLERAIREAIAAAPPLTDDQRTRLGRLLTSGGASK